MNTVDVLAEMDDAAHALNSRDTMRERNSLLDARDAVAELLEAAGGYFDGWCQDEANDSMDERGRGYDTGCTREQRNAASRFGAAIAACKVSP